MIEGESVHVVFVGVPSAAEPKHEVPPTDVVDGLGHLRDRAGVVERGAGNHRPDRNSRKRSRDTRGCRPALPDTARLTAMPLQLEHEVIRSPEHVEPDLDGESRHGDDVPEAIDWRIVGDRVLLGDGQHQSQAHWTLALWPTPL